MTNSIIGLQKILQYEFNKEFTIQETKSIGNNLISIFNLLLKNKTSYEKSENIKLSKFKRNLRMKI